MSNPKYRCIHKSLYDNEYQIDIYDAEDLSSSTQEFLSKGNCFTLNYNGEEQSIKPGIISSNVTVEALIQDAAFETFISLINTTYEGRFMIYIYLNSSLYWHGVILQDLNGSRNQAKPYPYTINASDGFARLKEINYDNDGTLYTGRDTFIEHICNALNKLELRDYLSATSAFLSTVVDWWEDDMVSRAYDVDPLDKSDLDHEVFHYYDDVGDLVAKDTYFVLEQICIRWNAILKQANGQFFFIQLGEYYRNLSENLSIRVYKTDASNLSNTSAGDFIKTSFQIEAGGYYNYLPALREVNVDYKFSEGIADNLLPQDYAIPDTESLGDIDGGSGEQMLFEGIVRVLYHFGGVGSPYEHKPVVEIYLRVGAKYLTNKNGYIEWGDLNTDRYKIIPPVALPKTHYEKLIPISFTTPEIPTTGAGWFGCEVKLYDEDNNDITSGLPGTDTFEYEALDFLLKMLYSDGSLGSGIKKFRALNTTDGSTLVSSINELEIDELLTGDGPNTFSIGRLKVYDGADWVNSDLWKVAAAGTGYDINMLLVRECLSLQRTIGGKYIGRLRCNDGNIAGAALLTIHTVTYLLLRGKFTANDEQWDGVWAELSKEISNINNPAAQLTTGSYQNGNTFGGSVYQEIISLWQGIQQGVESLTAGVWHQITFTEAMIDANYSFSLFALDGYNTISLRFKDITTTGYKVWASRNCSYRWEAIRK